MNYLAESFLTGALIGYFLVGLVLAGLMWDLIMNGPPKKAVEHMTSAELNEARRDFERIEATRRHPKGALFMVFMIITVITAWPGVFIWTGIMMKKHKQ